MGQPVASLMMYARPQLDGAHNRLWDLIRQTLPGAPEAMSQNAPEFEVWQSPQLVLSQTCGMPYRLWLHDQVSYVGTPDYGLTDCPAGYYRSAFVVRADDPREEIAAFKVACFAYNVLYSQSGYAAPFTHVTPRGWWFENRLQTGAHGASAKAVAEGRADIAALDAVTWRLLQRHEPFAAKLRVLDWTAPTPGLPLITSKSQDPDTIFDAVDRAIDALEPLDREALGLRGLVRLPKEVYLSVPNPPEDYSVIP